jgi:hypothetical protein
VPNDGLMSRNYFPTVGVATNSPRNFAGATGSVNLSAAPMPTGDYNGNGSVDAADYVEWRDTLDQFAPQIGSGADGNANGMIDAGDYNYWRARFGNSASGAGSGSSVPEPAAAILLLLALAIGAAGRSRWVS